MSKIPEVFAIFEQKLAHVLSFTVVPLKSKDLKNALEEILTYFSGIVERASKAESRIAELEAERRWIPVSERLPEAETRVLAATPTGYMEVDWRFSEPIIDCGFANFFSLDNVTHWMPLPEPPEDNYVGDSDHEHDDRIL